MRRSTSNNKNIHVVQIQEIFKITIGYSNTQKLSLFLSGYYYETIDTSFVKIEAVETRLLELFPIHLVSE